MVRIRDTFVPQAENVQIYDRLFNEVYKEMFSRLLPLYHKIAEITGYPNVVG
jgi:sugar (pentulose or hexulose) kinase